MVTSRERPAPVLSTGEGLMSKRLAELKRLLAVEEMSPQRSQIYINDLKLSIADEECRIEPQIRIIPLSDMK